MLWLFLPAFNEGEALVRLLPAIDRALRGRDYAYRMVVVDDGSTDDEAAVLERFRQQMPIDVVTHPINRGLGETERDGFEYIAARCGGDDVIVRVEGDDTHDPEYIAALLSKLHDGYDVVNTSRFQPGGGQLGVDAYRASISRAANWFMQIVFGMPEIRDYSCGYRAYRAAVIQDAIRIFGNNFIQLKGLGFTSTLEIIVKLHLMGCRFAEVPFVLRYDKKRGGSKMIGSITTLGYVIMGLLYHWPLGGWRSQYRGLQQSYRQDAAQAVEKYKLSSLSRRRTASRISL